MATRVTKAKVDVGIETAGEVGPGLLAPARVAPDDTPADAASLARRIVELRIFADDAVAMNRGLAETGGALLAV